MARRGVGIGRTDFHNATIIGFMQRPVDKAAQSERTFKILASRTNAGNSANIRSRSRFKTRPRCRTFWRVGVAAPVGFYDARRRLRDGAARVAHTSSTVSASAPNSTGLRRMASNPAADGETLHSSKALAVRAIMGVGDQPQEASSLRKRRVAA